MTTRIWTRSAFHPAFRCGGWAWLREARGERTGQAGGERHTSGRRMALAGLVAALRDAPGGPVEIDLGDPALSVLARKLAAGQAFQADEAPSEDLDLWAQFATALKGRAVTIHGHASQAVRPGSKGGPGAFAKAWADLAQDKAKAGGTFTAAIPKPNLAKVDLP